MESCGQFMRSCTIALYCLLLTSVCYPNKLPVTLWAHLKRKLFKTSVFPWDGRPTILRSLILLLPLPLSLAALLQKDLAPGEFAGVQCVSDTLTKFPQADNPMPSPLLLSLSTVPYASLCLFECRLLFDR